uniref:DNA damage-regulated autophagy modulator protein 2-like n=1 Tax=Crassostrea virginica TaxID=6565 RepID=A0A8B8DBX2_CRAVI|nr:DNA damage-regulated autophagy modulator protein 2-like [Crassostrea virginica]
MIFKYFYLFPLLFAAILPVTFLITYAIAVSDDDVYPWFPYISDTGTLPPESCVFGQLINIAALLIMTVVFLRYQQLKTVWDTNNPKKNKVSLALGLLAGIGLSIVANFQVENVNSVHVIGAALAFLVGGAYFHIQTYISWSVQNLVDSPKILHILRLIICVLYDIFAVIGIVTTVVGDIKLRPTVVSTRLWTPNEEGYAEHVTSTVMEWIGSFLICSYAATFAYEFKDLRLEYEFTTGNTING